MQAFPHGDGFQDQVKKLSMAGPIEIFDANHGKQSKGEQPHDHSALIPSAIPQ
jgi:hypothetical protein